MRGWIWPGNWCSSVRYTVRVCMFYRQCSCWHLSSGLWRRVTGYFVSQTAAPHTGLTFKGRNIDIWFFILTPCTRCPTKMNPQTWRPWIWIIVAWWEQWGDVIHGAMTYWLLARQKRVNSDKNRSSTTFVANRIRRLKTEHEISH
jgi:hypothetical protein